MFSIQLHDVQTTNAIDKPQNKRTSEKKTLRGRRVDMVGNPEVKHVCTSRRMLRHGKLIHGSDTLALLNKGRVKVKNATDVLKCNATKT